MCHLTKATSVRRSNTLDGHVGAIDVVLLVHANVSVGISILGCNLSVCEELVKPLLRSYETALAMGCGIAVGLSKLCALQPRRLVGNDLGVSHLGDVTVDRVEGQGRGILLLANDLAIRHKAQLDQRLETITDTKCQTVSLIQ